MSKERESYRKRSHRSIRQTAAMLTASDKPHWAEPPGGLASRGPRGMFGLLPKLQMRFTSFHGTQVPVLVMLFLQPAEVGRSGLADKFLRRITTEHAALWRGIHCRDLGARNAEPGASRGRGRCVWQTLGGSAAASRACIFHMEELSPGDYFVACKNITSIPGRSREELLELYSRWREETRVPTPGCSRTSSSLDLSGEGGSEALSPAASAEPPRPWTVRAHCTFGLAVRHGRCFAGTGSLVLTPRAPLSASGGARRAQGQRDGGRVGSP